MAFCNMLCDTSTVLFGLQKCYPHIFTLCLSAYLFFYLCLPPFPHLSFTLSQTPVLQHQNVLQRVMLVPLICLLLFLGPWHVCYYSACEIPTPISTPHLSVCPGACYLSLSVALAQFLFPSPHLPSHPLAVTVSKPGPLLGSLGVSPLAQTWQISPRCSKLVMALAQSHQSWKQSSNFEMASSSKK